MNGGSVTNTEPRVQLLRCAPALGCRLSNEERLCARGLGIPSLGRDTLMLADAIRRPLLDCVFALLVAALSRMLEGTPADGLVRLARLGCQIEVETEEAPAVRRAPLPPFG